MARSGPEALEDLLEAGRLLSSQLDLDELLQTVMRLASKVVEAETASLLLLDESTQELYFHVALGLGEQASRLRLKLGQGVAGTVAQTRRGAVINEARSDPRWSGVVDAQSGFVTRSILAVPMAFQGRLVGVLEAINKKAGAFTDGDARAFESFASQAAVAIENARLFSSLKEQSFKLRTIFTEMGDAAALCDRVGRILLANPMATRLLGDAQNLKEGLAGLSVSPDVEALFKPEPIDFTAERTEGKTLILAGTATPVRDGWLFVMRDETEQRRREKLKRSFLSLISHKLKTPLASVLGFSEILIEELGGSSPPSPLLKPAMTIAREGRKLADLVDKLLRYTTLEAPEGTVELAPCPVDGLVAEAVQAIKPWLDKNGATVDYRAAADLAVFGNREQLREVVKNLLENAAKFDAKPRKTIRVAAESRDGKTVLRVEDTGRGIPPEDHERVFSQFHQIETFFTGQMDGWGLGLPYVKKVVENHGGKVELKSRLGEGTAVTLIFPKRPGS